MSNLHETEYEGVELLYLREKKILKFEFSILSVRVWISFGEN